MSFHLFRHLDEQTSRFKNRDMEDAMRFRVSLRTVNGRITKEVTGSTAHGRNSQDRIKPEILVRCVPVHKKMWRKGADFCKIATIVAIGVILTLAVWAMSLTDSQLRRFADIGTLITAIGGWIGIIFLIAYTRETYLLRKTAERQLESAEKPILLLDISSIDSQLGEQMNLRQPEIRNIGSGPAFNVLIEPIEYEDLKVQFRLPNVTYIEGKQRLPLTPFITQGGQASGLSQYLQLLTDLICKNKLPTEMTVAVWFDSITGKMYRALNRIRYDASKRSVSTVLVPPVDEISGEQSRRWQTGKVLDTERSRYFAGTVGSANTTANAQTYGSYGTYQGQTNTSQTALYRTYQTFLIEGETYAYLARERLRW